MNEQVEKEPVGVKIHWQVIEHNHIEKIIMDKDNWKVTT
jgi:hypothetical protein